MGTDLNNDVSLCLVLDVSLSTYLASGPLDAFEGSQERDPPLHPVLIKEVVV